jgi:sarcosine oxidase gamma subunit
MIPEEAWRFLQRWLWLLLAAIAAGGVLGVLFLPRLLGDGDNYSASAVLSVGRFASPAGVVTATLAADQGELLKDYTQSLAETSRTPRFLARVREKALARGLPLSAAAINAKVQVEPQPSLFLIAVQASDSQPQVAETLVTLVVEAISEEAQAQERNLRQALAQRAEQGQEQIMQRLRANHQRTLARLQELNAPALQAALVGVAGGAVGPETARRLVGELARLGGDPELVLLAAEAEALQRALTDLASAREAVEVALSASGGPFFLLQPVETVQEQPLHAVRTRDALVLGAGAGLAVGWLSASLAEQLLGRLRRRREG